MSAFRQFEVEAVTGLVGGRMREELLAAVLDSAELVSYEHTGSGYFLTVRHPGLPTAPVSCDKPPVLGTAGDVQAGFVVFLGAGELTLECHSWGGIDVPEDFRDREVGIEIVE